MKGVLQMTETKSLQERITAKGITMKVTEGAPFNPNMPEHDGWTCLLKCGTKRMTVPFYMGQGHNGREPEIDEVLDCLLSDATLADNCPDFDARVSETGAEIEMTADYLREQKTYKACQRTSKRLHNFLGEDYDTFAYETERL